MRSMVLLLWYCMMPTQAEYKTYQYIQEHTCNVYTTNPNVQAHIFGVRDQLALSIFLTKEGHHTIVVTKYFIKYFDLTEDHGPFFPPKYARN